MNIYENWNVFIANIENVPEQLDGDKLVCMVSKLSRTREERELLWKDAVAGVRTAWETLLNSYVPMIVEEMQKYVPQFGYNLNILMNCVEKVWEKISSDLYLNNFEYNMSHSIGWIVATEITLYSATKDKIDKMKKETGHNESEETLEIEDNELEETLEVEHNGFDEMQEKINTFISDENEAEEVKELLLRCRNERERRWLAFKFGLEDGIPKTFQETADNFGINRERIIRLEFKLRHEAEQFHKRKKLIADFLK